MGGLGRIWSESIRGYASSFGIVGSDLDDFVTFVRAIDEEYVAVQNEKAKAEMDKNKSKS